MKYGFKVSSGFIGILDSPDEPKAGPGVLQENFVEPRTSKRSRLKIRFGTVSMRLMNQGWDVLR